MKKTVRQADGSEVTFEGTVEELAELERRQKGDVRETPKKTGKKVLLDDLRRELREALDRLPPPALVPVHTHCVGCPTCKPWRFSRPWWKVPTYSPPVWISQSSTICETVTSDRIELAPGPTQATSAWDVNLRS